MNLSDNHGSFAARLGLALAASLALVAALSGCSYYTLRENPVIDEAAFQSNPPASLAVMPVKDTTAPAKEGGRRMDEATRRALYTALSTLHYRDVELQAVDDAVASRSIDLDVAPLDLPAVALEKTEVADALLYATVLKKSKFWLFVYSHVRLKMNLRIVDSRNGDVLYSNDATLHNRRFSPPVSIGGIVESLFLTLWHIRDSEIDNSLEEFGRRIAKTFPNPQPSSGGQVAIDAVFVNPSQGTLHTGDRIEVEVRGTPGQIVSYDIGKAIADRSLEEKSPGVYVGTYYIQPGDESEAGVVRASMRSAYSNASASMSYVGGSFRIDASSPERPRIQRVEFEQDALVLNLALPRAAQSARFQVFRMENPAQGFVLKGQAEGSSWRDRGILPERQYSYLVKAIDAQGNPGATSELCEVRVPRKGPTVLSERLTGQTVLQQFSSPYVVMGTCRVPAGSALRVGPGVALRVGANSCLAIQGEALFEGTEESPVHFEGAAAGCLLAFDPANSSSTLEMHNVRFRKARTAIDARGGNVFLRGVQFDEIGQTAVKIAAARSLVLSRCLFTHVRTAVEGSVSSAEIDYCTFDRPARGVSLYAPALAMTANDFVGQGLAVAQLSPVSTPVDRNFFDTTDPWALLQRLQGPCVFRTIYGSRSAERLAFAPYPESYETYRASGDHFYERRARDAAMRYYFRAWWLRKEPRVGMRLVELLRRDSPMKAFRRNDPELRAALSVARTLALMQPEDPVALNQYAGLLEDAGYRSEAAAILARAKTPPQTPLTRIQGLGGRFTEGVREFITP